MTLAEQLAAVTRHLEAADECTPAQFADAGDAHFYMLREVRAALALLPGLREGLSRLEAIKGETTVAAAEVLYAHPRGVLLKTGLAPSIKMSLDSCHATIAAVLERAEAAEDRLSAIEAAQPTDGIRAFAQDEQEKLILHQRGEIAAMTAELGELRRRIAAAEATITKCSFCGDIKPLDKWGHCGTCVSGMERTNGD